MALIKEFLNAGFKVYENRIFRTKKEIISLFITYIKLIKLSKRKINSDFQIKIFSWKIVGYNAKSLLFLFEEIFVNSSYGIKIKNDKPIIFDCGANVGMSVLFFKQLFPNSIIYAFEPNPISFKFLENNISNNNLSDVFIYNLALHSEIGEIKMFYEESIYGSLLTSTISQRGGDQFFYAKCDKLSNYMKDLSIDLVKIDVEGGEKFIIQDLQEENVLKNSKNYFVEYHSGLDNDNQLSSFISVFENEGFCLNIKADFNSFWNNQDILILFAKNEK